MTHRQLFFLIFILVNSLSLEATSKQIVDQKKLDTVRVVLMSHDDLKKVNFNIKSVEGSVDSVDNYSFRYTISTNSAFSLGPFKFPKESVIEGRAAKPLGYGAQIERVLVQSEVESPILISSIPCGKDLEFFMDRSPKSNLQVRSCILVKDFKFNGQTWPKDSILFFSEGKGGSSFDYQNNISKIQAPKGFIFNGKELDRPQIFCPTVYGFSEDPKTCR